MGGVREILDFGPPKRTRTLEIPAVSEPLVSGSPAATPADPSPVAPQCATWFRISRYCLCIPFCHRSVFHSRSRGAKDRSRGSPFARASDHSVTRSALEKSGKALFERSGKALSEDLLTYGTELSVAPVAPLKALFGIGKAKCRALKAEACASVLLSVPTAHEVLKSQSHSRAQVRARNRQKPSAEAKGFLG